MRSPLPNGRSACALPPGLNWSPGCASIGQQGFSEISDAVSDVLASAWRLIAAGPCDLPASSRATTGALSQGTRYDVLSYLGGESCGQDKDCRDVAEQTAATARRTRGGASLPQSEPGHRDGRRREAGASAACLSRARVREARSE